MSPKVWALIGVLGVLGSGCRSEPATRVVTVDKAPEPELVTLEPREPRELSAVPAFEDFAVGDNSPVVGGVAQAHETRKDLPDRGRENFDATEMTPDFAGHYRIVSWGCGLSCSVHVVVNTETRQILGSFGSSVGVEYRTDSRLVLIGSDETVEGLSPFDVYMFASRVTAYAVQADTLYELGAWPRPNLSRPPDGNDS